MAELTSNENAETTQHQEYGAIVVQINFLVRKFGTCC